MHFSIDTYPINENLEANLIATHGGHLNWPLVYLLREHGDPTAPTRAYVGETANVVTRLKTHRSDVNKQTLKTVHLISSFVFNKSAALDIESNLIKYLSADGRYVLQNGNLGIANHQYYQQKEVYWKMFQMIWDNLKDEDIVTKELGDIDNSDVFKYSPYKSLSKEQISGLKTILLCLLDENSNVGLIKGGAGTGKSILAIFLFKLLKTDIDNFDSIDFDEDDKELFNLLISVRNKYGDLKMALVIPMASFRKTISKVFKNIKGLPANMVIGPSEVAKQNYDLLIVDEGHRLRRRVNLGPYFATFDKNSDLLNLDKNTSTELDWIQLQSKKSIIFYDEYQTIKPSDVSKESFKRLEEKATTRSETLHTQMRVKGGNQYVQLVHRLFNETSSRLSYTNIGLYDFRVFDDLGDMVREIKAKNKAVGLSRMIAGFAWKWLSKSDPEIFDIEIGNVQLKWNSKDIDWVNSENAINEVGCIHTTQGYDLNYAGVIIGPELDYDFDSNQFVIYKHKYQDKSGKNSIKDDKELLNYITNIYKTIMLRGIEGTYAYVCNENLKKYLKQYLESSL